LSKIEEIAKRDRLSRSAPDRQDKDDYHVARLMIARDLLLSRTGNDREAALNLLGMCADAIQDESPVPGPVAAWLAVGLRAIANGQRESHKAFGFPPRKPGVKAGDKDAAFRRYTMAHHVVYLLRCEGVPTKEAAYQVVFKLLPVERETIDSAWDEYHERAEQEIERQIATLGRAVSLLR
jgi:hypothetical protein